MKRNESSTHGSSMIRSAIAAILLAAGLATGSGEANAAATIVIHNVNLPGVGFNDTTPAAPVGGNPGTTLGAQRLFAFTFAADRWGATLTSNVPILIDAQFTPLDCNASQAVLGSAGATEVFSDFTNAPLPATWYSYALANKLAKVDLDSPDVAQIEADFNSEIGKANCLTGTFFYLGVDNNHGADIDFVTVLLHEMGHGIGFQTFTDGESGEYFLGMPSVWDHLLFDDASGKHWTEMTDAQRAASSLNDQLVWTGSFVNTSLPSVLTPGTPRLTISGPAAGTAAQVYSVGTASFGPALGAAITGQVMPIAVQTAGAGAGCEPFSPINALAAKGNIALIDRGVCGFAVKTKNAQNAGAIAVIIADNVAGSPPAGLGGSDPTVKIPAVRITLDSGNALKASLTHRSRTSSGVVATLGLAGSQYQGADALGRMKLFAPNPYQEGSSVSHYDTSAFRNQLMEPSINGDLTHSVLPPEDLTFRLLQDTGW